MSTSPALVIRSPSRMTPSWTGFDAPATAFADESAASTTTCPALPSSLTANSGPYSSASYSASSPVEIGSPGSHIVAVMAHPVSIWSVEAAAESVWSARHRFVVRQIVPEELEATGRSASSAD